MKSQAVSIVKILIIGLAIATLAGATVSKAQGRGNQKTGAAGESRPEQYSLGRPPFSPGPPPGLTGIRVPAIVSESPAQFITMPLPAGVVEIRAAGVPVSTRPIPNNRGFPLDTQTNITTLDGTSLLSLTPPVSGSFDSTNFDDNQRLTTVRLIPPDPIAAAGPNHVVNVVNVTVRFHQKDGFLDFESALALPGTPPGGFFSVLDPLTLTFDPKVIYDQYEGRFLIVAPETSRIFVAVSDDADPIGTWFMFSIDSKTEIGGVFTLADYPGFAVDEEAVYITANMFGFSSGFAGVRLWVIDKGLPVGNDDGFYDGMGTTTVTKFNPYAGGGNVRTTQPAHIFGTAPASVGTFLVSYGGLTSGSQEFVQVVRIDNPLGETTFTQQFLNVGNIEIVNPVGSPALPDAPQLGGDMAIEVNDRRALNAVWRDDSLWMTATIRPNSGPDSGETTAHWFQLNTTSLNSITLTDQGSIGGEDIAQETYTFFPSLAVNFFNDVAIGFSASGPSIHPGSYYTTRQAADPPGTTNGSEVLRTGLDSYVRTFGFPRNRWGDYSGMAVDPENQCFWVYNEHALLRGNQTNNPLEDGRWGTAYGFFCPPCSESFDLTADQWKQISLSCDVGAANTVNDVFGDDLTGDYGTHWGLFKWNGTSYNSMNTESPLDEGRGYWIKTLNTEQSVTVEGVLNQVIEFPLFPLTVDAADGVFNMVGIPFKTSVCWADVQVVDGMSVLSLDEADPLDENQMRACDDMTDPVGKGCRMSRKADKWGGSYQSFDGESMGMEGTLEIFDGFWVKAFKAGLKLRIPLVPSPAAGCYTEMMAGPAPGGPATGEPETAGPAPGGPAAAGPNEGTAEGWFVRLIAESGDLRDSGNVLGQLPDSVNRYDRHDLEELAPFDSPYLTIVFPHPNWGRQAGDYNSDFHALQERLDDQWSFEVRASEPSQQVTLRWEGEASLLEEMLLIDQETGESVLVQPDGSFTFTMNEERHSFWWLAGRSRPRGRP